MRRACDVMAFATPASSSELGEPLGGGLDGVDRLVQPASRRSGRRAGTRRRDATRAQPRGPRPARDVELLDDALARVRCRRPTAAPRRDRRAAPRASGASTVEPRERAAEQVGGGRQVLARERAPPGRGRRSAARRPERARRARPSGPSWPRYPCACSRWKRDDLLVLADHLAGLRLEPVGEALVQLGARLLEHRRGRPRRGSARGGSGRPARRSSTCPRAATSSLRRSVSRCPSMPRPHGRRAELGDRAAVELLADHRRRARRRALVAAEALEARRDQRVDRRRHLDVDAVGARPSVSPSRRSTPSSTSMRTRLADEQRVALGRLEDPLGQARRAGRPARAARRRACGCRPRRAGRAR